MILFVDDEKRRMENYIMELEESGYSVKLCTDVDDALYFLTEHSKRIELIILDIMMPPGKSFNLDDTQMGFRTGIRFYEKIREVNKTLPVIIFTHVADPNIAEKFYTEKNCWFFRKINLLEFELVEEINNILNKNEKGKR